MIPLPNRKTSRLGTKPIQSRPERRRPRRARRHQSHRCGRSSGTPHPSSSADHRQRSTVTRARGTPHARRVNRRETGGGSGSRISLRRVGVGEALLASFPSTPLRPPSHCQWSASLTSPLRLLGLPSLPVPVLCSPRRHARPPERKRAGEGMQPPQHCPPAAGAWGGVAGAGAGPTTVDEASMERSKSFIKALQELKNLRPQLYSASEYCEKSYLNSEQKQMVLDNLKDYAVRAVVNAVDHLGTVAYKLKDLFEQQASDVSTYELKVARLNQQIFTCQVYTDKEGLRQQQMMGANIKHHKHYILPPGYKRSPVHGHQQADTDQESKPRPYPSAKTLSWHLSSENSTKANTHKLTFALVDTAPSKPASGKERSASPMRRPLQFNRSTSSDAMQKVGTKNQSGVKEFSTFHSFGNPKGRAIQKAPVGTKSMLAALFIKHKSSKMKKITVR